MFLKILYIIFLFGIIVISSDLSPDPVQESIRKKLNHTISKNVYIDSKLIYCNPSLQTFYKKRYYQPAWNHLTFILAFIQEIRQCENEGLIPKDYHLEIISEKAIQLLTLKSKSPNDTKAELDILLTDAFLLYVSHQLTGKLNPETIDPKWHIATREGNPVKLLEEAIVENDMKSLLVSIKPKHNVYTGLKQALKIYKNIQNNGGWHKIPPGNTIKPGMEDLRIPLIRNRLIITLDLGEQNISNPNLYDENLVAGIKRFQIRHGIESNGNIGKQTLAAMNVTVEERIDQIIANLERWRWLPQQFEKYYIKINIVDFTMEVIKNNKVDRIHKIIVGRPYRKTPVFYSKMSNLILNPSWTVPPTILKNDIIPEVRKNPEYLNKKRIRIYDNQGNLIDPASINWNSSSAKKYKYYQPPGSDNALGNVKFMFPNKYNVYLHDTPSKELFEKTERAFSSGCIRVHKALDLAIYLLNDSIHWNKGTIDSIVKTRNIVSVPLKEKPTVYILYWTSWADNQGVIQFRNDIYLRDPILISALKKPFADPHSK